VELGVTFRSDVNGYITAIRFYKSPGNTGVHVGSLWSGTGMLLARATFLRETASGWQQVKLSKPVAITANTSYVASYHASIGHYSVSPYYFATSSANNGSLHALANGVGHANGPYTYGSGSAFPRNTYHSSNYLVDVLFATSAAAGAPSITAQPANQTVTASQTATFTVVASGTAPLTYQWNRNGTAIAGATSSSYTTLATTSSDNGSQFTAFVSNSVGSATSNAATLSVTTPASLQITTPQLPGGTVAGPYSVTLAASGGSTPYSWSLSSGQLPSGLSLNPAGSISGTPTLAGSFPFTVQVKDAATRSASANFSINIATPTPTVNITSPANGSTVSGTVSVKGSASDTVSLSSVQVSVDGGPFSNASGTNNWNFDLDTSSLSNGSHSLTAQANDVAGNSATSSPLTLVVNNGTVANNCTLYASASGNDGNSGTSPSAPKTFRGAANAAQPGAVVCVLGGNYSWTGSFYPPRGGTSSAWIVYKAFGDSPVNITYTGTSANWTAIFDTGNNTFPNGPSYLEFNGFNLDGRNQAVDGFHCNGSHHLRIKNNTIQNFGAAGIATLRCDYITSDHNIINHNGYGEGWSSGISYNSNQWLDSYAGFHNIVANNTIAGSYDGSSNHTDGNGIIMDLGGSTPPVLIVNNAVYGNGGRCIQALSNTNFWIVNNTCYKNGLDLADRFGSLVTQNASNGYFINNIAIGWNGRPPYAQLGSNTNVQYYADMYFGASNTFSDSQFIQADPLFLNPPLFNPVTDGQYATALMASLLKDGLTVLPLSPALGRGIDPSTLSGLPADIVTDLKKYIYKDLNGNPRPQGNGFDLGAYQH
jgi:hypothetical protein